MPCTTVTNFCNEGKVMLLLSMVRYQVLFYFRHTRYRRYCYEQAMQVRLQVVYHVLSYKSATGLVIRGFFEYGVFFFKTLYFFNF